MEDKRFNFNDITDFEKHIELSIPNFLTLDNIFRNIAHEYAQPESAVVDLGCSTGRFLTSLNQIPTCEYIGIDTVDMEQSNDQCGWAGPGGAHELHVWRNQTEKFP